MHARLKSPLPWTHWFPASSAAREDNFFKMTFPFQWGLNQYGGLRQVDDFRKANAARLSFTMTSSNGNVFRVIVRGIHQLTGEFSSQRPVTRSFDVFWDLRPNKRLSKQSTRRWFETPSRSIWPHYNVCASSSLSLLSPSSRHCPRPIRHLITSIVVIMIIIRNNHHTACCWIRIVMKLCGPSNRLNAIMTFYGVM